MFVYFHSAHTKEQHDTDKKEGGDEQEITEDDLSFVIDKVYSGSDGDIEIRTHPEENSHCGKHTETDEKGKLYLIL